MLTAEDGQSAQRSFTRSSLRSLRPLRFKTWIISVHGTVFFS
jgi:hypothetical protein